MGWLIRESKSRGRRRCTQIFCDSVSQLIAPHFLQGHVKKTKTCWAASTLLVGGFILQWVVSLLPPDPLSPPCQRELAKRLVGSNEPCWRGDLKKTKVLENSRDFHSVEPKNGYKNACQGTQSAHNETVIQTQRTHVAGGDWHGRLMEVCLLICTNSNSNHTPNIHLHSYKATWIKHLIQGQGLGWSAIHPQSLRKCCKSIWWYEGEYWMD